MMNLLAKSDFEVIVGIAVFLFWIIAAIGGKLKGAMNKQPPANPGEETPLARMQREIAEQIERMHGRPVAPQPPPLPQIPQMQRQPQVQRQPQAQRQPQGQRQRSSKRVQQIAAPPPPAAEASASPITAPALAPRPAPLTVPAPVIRRWLTPTTLRQQFILTELFQPPLSMREDR